MDAKFPHVDNKDSDQTARMRALIGVLDVRTCPKVRFPTFLFVYFVHWVKPGDDPCLMSVQNARS